MTDYDGKVLKVINILYYLNFICISMLIIIMQGHYIPHKSHVLLQVLRASNPCILSLLGLLSLFMTSTPQRVSLDYLLILEFIE